jgi:RNA polymerase sigma-B factor
VTKPVAPPAFTDADRRADDARAGELIAAMAALPRDDPSRAALRDRAIEAWLPMAYRLSQRYARSRHLVEDVAQTAAVGLIKAVDGFDPDRGVPFPGYAVPTILGEIKRYFRDRTWAVRIPRRLQEMRPAITDAESRLAHTLGRPATVADVAAHLHVSEEDVVEGLAGATAYNAVSLSAPATEGASGLGEFIGADDHGYELVELRLALGPALACLTERERHILALRFYGNQSQNEIAGAVGVSQMHVSRLITAALAKLRTHLGPEAY